MMVTAVIYLGYALLLFVVKGISSSKGKMNWFPKFAGYAMFTAFAFFFIMPLIKVFDGEMGVQLLLIVIWLVLHMIFFVKVETFYKIVLPTAGEPKSKWTIVYYISFLILALISGGGNFMVTRIITDSYGQEPTMNYFSYVLYSIGCWLGTLAAVMSIGMQGKLTKVQVERKDKKEKVRA